MRKAEIKRVTKETEISVKLAVDGPGESKIETGIGLLDHLLELFSFWGVFDLEISAKGDLKVDIHHTNEDIGIALGKAFKEALADKCGIRRIGWASVPMEEVSADVTADICGRGYFKFIFAGAGKPESGEGYGFGDAEHFFDAFAKQLGMNLHVKINGSGSDLHSTLEPAFKALGIALRSATEIDPRRKGIPSSKGVID